MRLDVVGVYRVRVERVRGATVQRAYVLLRMPSGELARLGVSDRAFRAMRKAGAPLIDRRDAVQLRRDA